MHRWALSFFDPPPHSKVTDHRKGILLFVKKFHFNPGGKMDLSLNCSLWVMSSG